MGLEGVGALLSGEGGTSLYLVNIVLGAMPAWKTGENYEFAFFQD